VLPSHREFKQFLSFAEVVPDFMSVHSPSDTRVSNTRLASLF
jgi:hypothetical protein